MIRADGARWLLSLRLAPLSPATRAREMMAFLSRLDGGVGLVRIGDPLRCIGLGAGQQADGPETWSDGTLFDDATGWSSTGISMGRIAAAAERGDEFITVDRLPSAIEVLKPGDMLSVRRADGWEFLHEACDLTMSDASGTASIRIRPRVQAVLAFGASVVFDNPRGVFRVTSDGLAASIGLDAGYGGSGGLELAQVIPAS